MSILIKNGLVYDGSGNPPVKANVLLKDGRIARVGDFDYSGADETVDAVNAAVMPGFIDVNTDSDHYLGLFSDPGQGDFLRQGVTTIIGGNCGASLAPLLDGSLNSIRKWGDVSQVNVGWRSVGEFLAVLKRQGLGVNFGTLVGHSTVRRAIAGDALRDLSEEETDVFRETLIQAFKDGAFGLSTGLGYSHSRNVPYRELLALAKVAARFGRVYATHLRDEAAGLLGSFNETMQIAREAGVNLEITHYRPIRGFEKDYEETLILLEKESSRLNIHFDLYPYETSTTSIYKLLPEWAQRGGFEMMLNNLNNAAVRERISRELDAVNLDDFVVAKVPSNLKFVVGKPMRAFAERERMSAGDALTRLMFLTNLKAVLFHRNINLDAALQAMKHSRAIVSSNGASLPEHSSVLKHERYLNTFPRFLSFAAEKSLMPLEKGVVKITSLPAAKYGVKNRGLIKEGYAADIAVFKDDKIAATLVNGEIAMRDGELAAKNAGRILRYEEEH